MLQKILKIVKTIDTCKFLHQLKHCLIMIENFERDEKPRDERIVEDLLKYYEVKYNEITIVSELELNDKSNNLI